MLYNSNGLYTKNDLSQCTNNIQPSTIVRLAQLLHYYMIFYVNTDKSSYIFIKTFLFWHNYIFTRNGTDMQVKVPCALHLLLPYVTIYSTVSKPENRYWCSLQSLFRLYQLYMQPFTCECVCMCTSMQFNHKCSCSYHQKYSTELLSPQGSLVLLHLQPQFLIPSNH